MIDTTSSWLGCGQPPAAEQPLPKRTKYPHIGAAAAHLGVRRESMWRALEGQWHLPRLAAGYRAFAAEARAAKGAR